MNLLFSAKESPRYLIQTRLFLLAAVFVFLGCLVLTFAPAVRLHSWLAEYRWQQWVGFVIWLGGFAILNHQANRFLPDRDPYLLPIFALLTGWGMMMIYRLSPGYGFRQSAWLAIAIIGLLIAMRISNLLANLRRYKYIWLTCGILLTLLTFIIGTYPGGEGPDLWLGFGVVYIQPSELLKLLLIVYLSAYLADSLPAKFRLTQLLAPTLIILGAALLVLIAQRDLGTASLFVILYTLVIYLASGKRRILLISSLVIVAALVSAYLVFDVIQLRVEAWLNPWLDPRARSYQIIQSMIALANGGLTGRGLGLGSPGIVPVAHSDFIYPSIIEEFGFVGGAALVITLAFFSIRGISISLHAPNQFHRFLAIGVTAYFAVQSVLIMGGTVRLLPLTGVTLPFLSYGGTSLVTSFFAGLLLMIVSNQSEDQPAAIERTQPYFLIGTLFLAGFTAVILMTGWWSLVRSGTLLARSDNPRRVISDNYVHRGTIFDRNNIPIAESVGKPGSYQRVLNYPNLSAILGYSNANYGQTGLEFSLDGYLRGVTSNTTNTVFITRLLYGQFPPGFDLRLSIDLAVQQYADENLTGQTGALIVMNAESGEILAMSTSPTFDANHLEELWETWMVNESAPLLNRATLAQYPPGASIGGLILGRYLATSDLPFETPYQSWNTNPEFTQFCAILPGWNPTWGKLVSSGCIKSLEALSKDMTVLETLGFLGQAGLTLEPDIPLETVAPVIPLNEKSLINLFTGSTSFLISPLQAARMAAILSNGGELVTPLIASSYKPPDSDWVIIDKGEKKSSFPVFSAPLAVSQLTQGDFFGWEVSALALHQEASISWYLAGTPTNWQGTPLVIVVALEEGTPELARTIGRSVLQNSISPSGQ